MPDAAAVEQVLSFLPQALRRELSQLPAAACAQLEEIRLKPGLPVLLRLGDGEAFLGEGGRLLPVTDRRQALCCSESALQKLCLLLAESSLYALEEELRRGFLTLPGGHRVGITGRAVLDSSGALRTVTAFSGVNIRIARPCMGQAADLLPRLLSADGRFCSTLLLSPPRAGKTTLLRALTCLLSDGIGVAPHRMAVADERSEIAAMRQGMPQLPVGLRTDVMDACPKAEAMSLLLRSMSPDVLVADEIGRAEDVFALREAARCGVAVLTSAHACDREDLLRRPLMAQLMEEGAFRRLVRLSRREGPGTVEEVIEL